MQNKDIQHVRLWNCEGLNSWLTIVHWYGLIFGVLENFSKVDDLKILDAGCGEGMQTRLIAEFTCKPVNVTGIDIDRARIEVAKDLSPFRIKYKYCAIEEIEDNYDLICLSTTWMYFKKSKKKTTAKRLSKHCKYLAIFEMDKEIKVEDFLDDFDVLYNSVIQIPTCQSQHRGLLLRSKNG